MFFYSRFSISLESDSNSILVPSINNLQSQDLLIYVFNENIGFGSGILHNAAYTVIHPSLNCPTQ